VQASSANWKNFAMSEPLQIGIGAVSPGDRNSIFTGPLQVLLQHFPAPKSASDLGSGSNRWPATLRIDDYAHHHPFADCPQLDVVCRAPAAFGTDDMVNDEGGFWTSLRRQSVGAKYVTSGPARVRLVLGGGPGLAQGVTAPPTQLVGGWSISPPTGRRPTNHTRSVSDRNRITGGGRDRGHRFRNLTLVSHLVDRQTAENDSSFGLEYNPAGRRFNAGSPEHGATGKFWSS